MRLKIIKSLIIIIITLVGMEATLAIFDPWGARYYHDMDAYWSQVIDERGLPEGNYTFSNFAATISSNRTRIVPATNEAAPQRLLLIGDSVTFGWGVNDVDTYANQLAIARPDLHIINAGVTGHNSEQAIEQIQHYGANVDMIVYLAIDNDAEPRIIPSQIGKNRLTWMSMYLSFIARREYPNSDYERYEQDLARILEDDRVIGVAWSVETSANPIAEMVAAAGGTVIYSSGDVISFVDPHPNAAGHQAIAGDLLTLIP